MESSPPKPQPTPPPPPSPSPPALLPPPAPMTMAELDAAIAELPGKKQRLREAFDRLVACSPVGAVVVPFCWDDLDAHVSSLQCSIALRFRQLQAPQLAASATATPTTANRVERLVEHLAKEGREHHGGEGNAADEGKLAKKAPPSVGSEAENDGVEEAIEAPPGQKGGEKEENEEMEAPINVSPTREYQSKYKSAKDAMAMPCEKDDVETKPAAAEGAPAANSPVPAFTGGGGGAEAYARKTLAAACANTDASRLARVLFWGGKGCYVARRQFLPALLAAAEPHALVVRAVRDFLLAPALAGPKKDRVWESCVALLTCVPKLTVRPPAGTLGEASRLAEDWKEMIGRPGICSKNLGRLSVWGLFNFLVSYNISLEFDAEEIIHFFGLLPDEKKESCISLCRCLGLLHKMADSVDHLIESGQQLVAIRLACTLNLTDKYPPLPIMKQYVQNAKKTAHEILSKENDSESLNQAMSKQVKDLILSWTVVGESNIDPVHCNSIKAEITELLHKYANKRNGQEDPPSYAAGPHQKHHQVSQGQHHLQQQPQEDQQQQLQNQLEGQEQDRSIQMLRQKRKNRRKRNQSRQQRQNAQEMNQHRFYKQRKLYHGRYSQGNVGPGIRDHLSQHFSGIPTRASFAPYTRHPW